METTFGKTVETRLLTGNQLSKPQKPSNFNQSTDLINLNNQKQLQINLLKQQKQKLQEKYQNEIHNLRLKHQKHQQNHNPSQISPSCASSILVRKSYKHLFNNNNHQPQGVSTGYASDSECFSRLYSNQSFQAKHKFINSNHHQNSNYNQYATDYEDDDARSCVSTRTRLDCGHNRFKSLDRQNLKYFRHETAKLNTQNKEDFNSEKFKSQARSFTYDSNDDSNDRFITPKLVYKCDRKAAETVNLTNYLTWKNFNCNPANSILTQKITNNTQQLEKENREFTLRNYNCNETNRSISTPGTPFLSSSSTLPR